MLLRYKRSAEASATATTISFPSLVDRAQTLYMYCSPLVILVLMFRLTIFPCSQGLSVAL